MGSSGSCRWRRTDRCRWPSASDRELILVHSPLMQSELSVQAANSANEPLPPPPSVIISPPVVPPQPTAPPSARNASTSKHKRRRMVTTAVASAQPQPTDSPCNPWGFDLPIRGPVRHRRPSRRSPKRAKAAESAAADNGLTLALGPDMSRRTLPILLALAAAGGCKRSAKPAPPMAAAPAPADVRTDGKGASKPAWKCTPLVYVDGEPKAASPTTNCPRNWRSTRSIAASCATTSSCSAPMRQVQRVDFHVAGDTVFVAGDDLRKQRRVTFHFSDGIGGRRASTARCAGDLTESWCWSRTSRAGMLKDDGRRGVRVNVDGCSSQDQAQPARGQRRAGGRAEARRSGALSAARFPGVALGDDRAHPRHQSRNARRDRVVRVSGRRARRRHRVHGARQRARRDDCPRRRAGDPGARRRCLGESEPPTRPMHQAGELHAALDAHP